MGETRRGQGDSLKDRLSNIKLYKIDLNKRSAAWLEGNKSTNQMLDTVRKKTGYHNNWSLVLLRMFPLMFIHQDWPPNSMPFL